MIITSGIYRGIKLTSLSMAKAAEHMDELWERYDADRSGSIRRGPIAPEPALLYIVNLYG
jgi:hypothetical protein